MSDSAFSMLASGYDDYNSADFDGYMRFFAECAKRFSDIPVREVLDMACGTGELTKRLCEQGYDVCAFDCSADMLMKAREKCDGHDVAFSMQDMRDFELYGTVQATVCSYDSINYLQDGLRDSFSLVNNYTERGGIFVFDINTEYRYKNVFGDSSYVYENGDDMLVWQNYYNEKTRLCRFYLTEFTERCGMYERSDELQCQRYYSLQSIKRALAACGFCLCGIYGGTDFSPLTENSEKAYIIAKSVSGRAQG